MNRTWAVVGGLAVGVATMLGILQPWKRTPRREAPAPAATSPFKTLENRLEALSYATEARAKISNGDLEEAQELLAKAAALDPQSLLVLLYQAQLDMANCEYEAARRSFTLVLKRQSWNSEALAGRATALYELKEYAGAVEDATQAMISHRENREPLFTRAAAHEKLGHWEECMLDWTNYIAAFPEYPPAWLNRGNAHYRRGNRAAAVADWKQAVKLDPSLSDQLNPLITEADR